MYYIIYGFLYLVSLLPLQVLYLFSEAVYGLVFYILGYRKDIVLKNLEMAFPEKTEAERIKIAKQFYRNFTESFIEALKLLSSGKKFIERHSRGEFGQINELVDKGYNVNVMAGHQFNWEFANLLYAMNLKIPFAGVYMPIKNQALEKIFYDLRERYGTILISAHKFKSSMHEVFSKQYILALAADQNPGDPRNAYWVEFMGRPAPFVTGPAKGAVKNNVAVVFVAMKKIRRGYYEFNATLLTEQAAKHTEAELTLIYKNQLEKTIREDPANYLWSHRRWKYEWKEEYGPIYK